MEDTFKAWQIKEAGVSYELQQIDARIDDLPKGEVLIRVAYSSLNYKDVLSASGHRGITKNFPHVPGVDASGWVENSDSSLFKKGDRVFVTGFDLGMNTWGGFSEMIRVPAQWVLPCPSSWTLKDVMVLGTAGFTAGQSWEMFQQLNVTPDDGDILVTGATGGVGSVAVALLASQGYSVVAATRDRSQEHFLKSLGANEVLDSNDLCETSDRPMLKGRWAGVVETVGGGLLENALKSTQRRAVVTCCGMIASDQLQVSIFPFILRGVRLVGIDSAECPLELKRQLWQKLSDVWAKPSASAIVQNRDFQGIPEAIRQLKEGMIQGRVVFDIGSDLADDPSAT